MHVLLVLFPLGCARELWAVTRTWDGGAAGADANWTTAANWTTNIAPVAGDALVFPGGISKTTVTNNFAANTMFGAFSVHGSYTLRGAAVDLTNFVEAIDATGIIELNLRQQRPVLFSSTLGGLLWFKGTLTLNGRVATFDGLSGNHIIDGLITDTAGAASKVIINGSEFAPPLSGGGNSVVLNGTNLCPGPTIVSNTSQLTLNGSITSLVAVASSATLSGSGFAGQLSASGFVSPGGPGGHGKLTVGGTCTFASTATFAVGLAGATAGTTYDQLQCNNTVNLGSARLLVARDRAFVPAIGNVFTILNKTSGGAITGTFSGLPQGATLNVDSVSYQISYTGGNGNDVTLTVTALGPQFITRTWDGGGANGLWSTAANWDNNIALVATNSLLFPRTAGQAVCTNDFTPDTVFTSLRFTGSAATNNYPLLRGNSVRLLSGIVATNLGSLGAVALELPVKLAGSQTFTNGSINTAIELRSNLVVQPFTLAVRGPGVFRATGSITGTNGANQVQVNGGHFVVNGGLLGDILVSGGGELAGNGTVGALSVIGGDVTPGDGTTGILTVKGGLTLNSSSRLNFEVVSATPGAGHDQILVSTGSVSLGSAAMNVVAKANFSGVIGDTFTIINVAVPTSAVSGTFAGLPQGAIVTNNGAVFRISYSGGDGNDVTLTLVDTLSTGVQRQWAGLDSVTNLWSAPANWADNVVPLPGDSLLFSIGLVARRTNFNNLPPNTTFGLLRFDGDTLNYRLLGNPFRLNDGVRLLPASGTFNLALNGVMTVSNRLTLNRSQLFTNAMDGALRIAGGVALGTNTLSANVRNGTDISFDGSVTGAGRLEAGAGGRVNLNASNAVTGAILVSSGLLIARHPQALGSATAGPVLVGGGGTLSLQASNAVFTGSLITVTGRVEALNSPNSSLAAPVLVTGANAVFAASNNPTLFSLRAPLTNGSQLIVSALRVAPNGRIEGGGLLRGSLEADGPVHSGLVADALTGAGQVDAVICTNTFSSIRPGSTTDPTIAFAPLQAGKLQLGSRATVQFQLFPNRPGGGATNTALITSTAPDLGAAKLTLTALTNLAPGQAFMLLRNDSAAPVTNTFVNLPEGGFLGAANGNLGLQITYRGGDGNDVVVTVQSNTPPVLTTIGRFVNESNTLAFTNSVTDVDLPPQTMTWALLSAPPGVILNPTTGGVIWTPTEAQGPSTNAIIVKVTDNGVPPLSTTGTVIVTVGEVNQPPVPVPVPFTNILLGSTLSLQLAATDPDIPVNPLTWSALLPSDATLSTSGLFSFTPTTNSPGTRTFTVSVRDFNADAPVQKSFTNPLTFSVRVDILRTVVNTNDSGPGSLRQAITDINATPGVNPGGGRIEFNIPGAGPFKVFLITALPPLLHDTTIDGYTQPGSHPNTLATGDNAVPLIELSGENMLTPANGLSWSGARVTVRGLILNRWDSAIATGRVGAGGPTSNAVVEGCFIGTDPTGTQRRTNRLGVNFLEAFGGRIGGLTPAQRNLISASSQAGISLVWDAADSFLHNVTIQNNFIGTDRSGTNALGNGGFGIFSEPTIPTTNSVIADNVIAANGQGGLQLAGARNYVLRNKIGVGTDGAAALGNGGPGIEVIGNRHLIGGNDGADANLIANNTGPGVHISPGTNNAVLGNSIFRNGGLGIDLGNPGPDPNDLGDLDSGPNNLQNTPSLAGSIVTDSSAVTVNGTLSSAVLTPYRVEFFHSPDFAPGNQAQAKTFLGSTDVTTDGNGNAGFSVVGIVPVIGGFITATATDPAGNTSELSAGAAIQNSDFYAGVLPRLSIVSGDHQTGIANLFLPNPLVVLVTDTNGTPLSDAPVTFAVLQGDAALASGFSQDRLSLLPARTTGDGLAQVFCHLGPTIGANDLITATIVSGARFTNVIFSATSIAPVAQGILLQGDPNSPALGALPDIGPTPVPQNEVEDGVIMTRLEVFLELDATIGQVNSALQAVGGAMVTTLPQEGAMAIAVPPQPDLNALVGLTQILNQMPGINRAFLDSVASFSILPPSPAGSPDSRSEIAHLLPTRFSAAWNAAFLATNNCGANKPKVLVSDDFTDPSASPDFVSEVPLFNMAGVFSPTNQHGLKVTTTLAARLDEKNPTGANPFNDCLSLRLAGLTGGLFDDIKITVEAFPASGKFILNCSWGFNNHCTNGCTRVQFGTVMPDALKRAYWGVLWNRITLPRRDDVLICTAAGNDRDQDSAQFYPGLGNARFGSPFSIAAESDTSLSFVQDAGFWDPSLLAVGLGLPSMKATSTEFAGLQRQIQNYGLGVAGPARNVLIVGSTKRGTQITALTESDFSDSGADVYAVGEKVFVQGEPPVDGTSFTSPQVAGLASYMWMLSSNLRNQPVSKTRTAILLNARSVQQPNLELDRIVDAYASVLSLDQSVLPTKTTAPVRFAIMDVNNDGKFDEQDLLIHLQDNGIVNTSGVNDYGRSDLNGDGFTGGLGPERFDLDRVGSDQFGLTSYSVVTQSVEGLPIQYNENALSDLDVLCYCAYSGLYTGDTNTRASLIGDLCTAQIQVAVSPTGVERLTGQSVQFFAAVNAIADQRVTWSVLPPDAGTITPDGLFTAGCPTNLNIGQDVIIRATSLAVTNRSAEATVHIKYPIGLRFHEPGNQLPVRPFTLFVGDCSVPELGVLPMPLSDFRFRLGCGSNDVLGALSSACGAGPFFDLAMDAFPVTFPNINETHRAGWEARLNFVAPVATTVTVSFGSDWTGDSTRVGVTKQVTALFDGGPLSNARAAFVVNNGVVTENTILPPFQVPQGTNIDINLDAICFGGCSGGGRAWNITFAPASPVGIFQLDPAVATAAVLEPLTYTFSWTVPTPENWHDLRDLQLRIRDDQDLVLWLRFNEADRTFTLFNEQTGRFGRSVAGGSAVQLQTPLALLDLGRTSVVASGPTSPTVTLNLGLVFKPPAAGHTYSIEVEATDDSGRVADFMQAGILTVSPSH